MSRSTWACELKCLGMCLLLLLIQSRSTWACELKWLCTLWWICSGSHAPRERVSWNGYVGEVNARQIVTLHVSVWVEMWLWLWQLFDVMSRSTWACELKFDIFISLTYFKQSRSTWACELKWNLVSSAFQRKLSRSTWACELKSRGIQHFATLKDVTLHVSVWVEISTPLIVLGLAKSRSTWACELKSLTSLGTIKTKASRSTWACELKS